MSKFTGGLAGGDGIVLDLATSVDKNSIRMLESSDGLSDTMPDILC